MLLSLSMANPACAVYEILLAYVEKKDWREAFLQVIPERKGAAPLPAPANEQSAASTSDNENNSALSIAQSAASPSAGDDHFVALDVPS